MRNHVKIRKDYTILVRARKLDEAQKLLEIMWDRSESNPQMVEPVKKEVVKQEIKKDKPAEEVGHVPERPREEGEEDTFPEPAVEEVNGKNDEIVVPGQEPKSPVKEVSYDSLDSLDKIKGIGKKTIKDIKTMFNNIKGLKVALKKNKVALRDDIVEKLKEVLM